MRDSTSIPPDAQLRATSQISDFKSAISLCLKRHYSALFRAFFTFSARRPNIRPPQRLQTSPITFFAYCHLQLFASERQTSARPKSLQVPTNAEPPIQPQPGRRTVATGGARCREASRAQPVVSIPAKIPPRQGWRRRSNAPKKPPKSRLALTQARHASWHNSRRPCVTLCHLGIDALCARKNPAPLLVAQVINALG